MKIIVVDDEQWIVTGLTKIIGKQFPQHDVRWFTDPNDTLDAMREALPDLLITDIRMEQMDGMTLIAKARELGLRHYAVLTGLEEVSLLREGIRLQLTDYLIKPVNKAELFGLIERVDALLTNQKREKKLEQLRLAAQYGETPAEGFDALPYRSFTISEQPTDAAVDQISIEHHGRALTLCFSTSPVEQTETDGISRYTLEDPSQLYAAVCTYCGEAVMDTQALAILIKNGEYEQLSRNLPLLLRTSEQPPIALMQLCESAGRQLFTWEACALSAEILHGNADEAIRALGELPMMIRAQSEAVATVLAWIDAHYMEDVTLTDAAAKVFLQANYLTTLFKKETEVGFVHYLNQKRVDAACRELLQKGEAPLNDVAQRAGFSAPRHFFNTFKRFTGVTPGEFRQRAEQDGFVN